MFGFGASASVEIVFDGSEKRPKKTVKGATDGAEEQSFEIYQGHEPVSGTCKIVLPPGKKVEHLGIKIEMIGQIELFYDRGNHYEFTSLVRELSAPSTMDRSVDYPFDFSSVDKQYESYNGLNVRLRYFLRVTMTRQYNSNIVKEHDFWVENLQTEPEINNSIKMEVGIEDCLHIEFEYDKSKYHLKDIVIGKIYFLLVRIKIKHMELAIIRRESAGSGNALQTTLQAIQLFSCLFFAHQDPICIMKARPSQSSRSWMVHQCAVRATKYLFAATFDSHFGLCVGL
jgi:hypothetical protein